MPSPRRFFLFICSVSNSTWITEDLPCITYGLRGVVHCAVEVREHMFVSSCLDIHFSRVIDIQWSAGCTFWNRRGRCGRTHDGHVSHYYPLHSTAAERLMPLRVKLLSTMTDNLRHVNIPGFCMLTLLARSNAP